MLIDVNRLKVRQKNISLPAFFPDGTHGFVKSVGAHDLEISKTPGIVVNTYHFLIDNSIDKLVSFGGIGGFMGFKGPVITDSGGFQAMSLVRRNTNNGKFTEEGIEFSILNTRHKIFLTPELSISTQISMGSDIVMCLDDCTDPDESYEEQCISVERTIRWAKWGKETFTKLTSNVASQDKPLIFGIIQGGNYPELREKCAQELIKIGFDGYAFGGFPVNKAGQFLHSILEVTVKSMPQDKPKYAMGVGKPEDIVACVKMGYNLFDCVLPTRDARHQRLYSFTQEPSLVQKKSDFYEYLHIGSGKYATAAEPISPYCDCLTCRNYSRGYLHHLFKMKDSLAWQLATIHNLRFYSQLMENLC